MRHMKACDDEIVFQKNSEETMEEQETLYVGQTRRSQDSSKWAATSQVDL